MTNAKCWWTEQRLPTLVLQQLYLAPVIHPWKWRVCATHCHNWPQTSAFKPKMLHLIWPPSSTGLSFNTSAPAVVSRCWSVISGWETPPPPPPPPLYTPSFRFCVLHTSWKLKERKKEGQKEQRKIKLQFEKYFLNQDLDRKQQILKITYEIKSGSCSFAKETLDLCHLLLGEGYAHCRAGIQK